MSEPEQRLKVLAFIESEISAGRPFPSRSAIKYHMGWKHTSGVLEALNYLAIRGYLTRERYRYRWVFDLANDAGAKSRSASEHLQLEADLTPLSHGRVI